MCRKKRNKKENEEKERRKDNEEGEKEENEEEEDKEVGRNAKMRLERIVIKGSSRSRGKRIPKVRSIKSYPVSTRYDSLLYSFLPFLLYVILYCERGHACTRFSSYSRRSISFTYGRRSSDEEEEEEEEDGYAGQYVSPV